MIYQCVELKSPRTIQHVDQRSWWSNQWPCCMWTTHLTTTTSLFLACFFPRALIHAQICSSSVIHRDSQWACWGFEVCWTLEENMLWLTCWLLRWSDLWPLSVHWRKYANLGHVSEKLTCRLHGQLIIEWHGDMWEKWRKWCQKFYGRQFFGEHEGHILDGFSGPIGRGPGNKAYHTLADSRHVAAFSLFLLYSIMLFYRKAETLMVYWNYHGIYLKNKKNVFRS